jgi:hypothetical protein
MHLRSFCGADLSRSPAHLLGARTWVGVWPRTPVLFRCARLHRHPLLWVQTCSFYLSGQVFFQEHLQAEVPSRTLLVVAVHDCEPQADAVKTKESILQDLQRIWSSVPKAEDKLDSELSEYFDVEVSFLPHPKYRPNEHGEALQALKAR